MKKKNITQSNSTLHDRESNTIYLGSYFVYNEPQGEGGRRGGGGGGGGGNRNFLSECRSLVLAGPCSASRRKEEVEEEEEKRR